MREQHKSMPGLKAVDADLAELHRQFLEERAAEFLALIPPKQRLEGIPLEERLEGIPPKQLLAGIPLEQLLAGLSAEQRAELRKLLLND